MAYRGKRSGAGRKAGAIAKNMRKVPEALTQGGGMTIARHHGRQRAVLLPAGRRRRDVDRGAWGGEPRRAWARGAVGSSLAKPRRTPPDSCTPPIGAMQNG